VRTLVGDVTQAKVNDVLSPSPDGFSTIFQLSAFPVAASPAVVLLVNLNVGAGNTIYGPSGFTMLDTENGVIQMTTAPAETTDFIQVPYYQWSYFSDATIGAAVDANSSDVYRAAIYLLNSILSDPAGTFFQKYQLGDDITDNASFSIRRIQAQIKELVRQASLPDNAGSVDVNWFQYTISDPMVFDPTDQGNYYVVDASDEVDVGDDL